MVRSMDVDIVRLLSCLHIAFPSIDLFFFFVLLVGLSTGVVFLGVDGLAAQ